MGYVKMSRINIMNSCAAIARRTWVLFKSEKEAMYDYKYGEFTIDWDPTVEHIRASKY